jgi:predicted PurR-regulated permease PerM
MMLHRFIKYLLKNQVILGLFIIAFGWFVIEIKDILVSIFLSYIIMASVAPAVTYLQKKGFPRVVSVLIPYIGILAAIFMLVLPLIPFVAGQIETLLTRLPKYIDSSSTVFGISIDQKQIEQYVNTELSSLSKNAFDFTKQVFGGFFSTITIFVVSFYLLMYHDSFKKYVARLFHPDNRTAVLKTQDLINKKLGAWLRGQALLCLFIGTLTWVGLTIIGLPYALPLALVAGILEAVPTLGPILSAIPAAAVGFAINPSLGFSVILFYMLLQAVENQLLVPKIMQHAVGLNPVVVILGVMIGGNIMGISGALLAIPFMSFLIVLFNSLNSPEVKEAELREAKEDRRDDLKRASS